MCENSEQKSIPPGANDCSSHLHTVLDLSSVVSDNEGRLHDGRKLDVAVSLVLSLELVQQCLVCGLREAAMQETERSLAFKSGSNSSLFIQAHRNDKFQNCEQFLK